MLKNLTLIATLILMAFTAPTPAYAEGGFLQKLFPTGLNFGKDSLIIETQEGKKYQFYVELAKTQTQLAKGLMDRKSLDTDSGMLFWFGGARKPAFWMRNTLIPLDMIFINRDGTIDHIHSNARPLDETHITSPNPVWAVLEINGGQAHKWGIQVGDTIIHPLFRNVLAE